MLKSHYQRLYGKLGTLIRGQTWYIDIVDACPMACPTCPTGIQGRRDGHRMSLDLFKRILDKGQRETKIKRVQLYRFGDPLLHPLLHEFIRECNRRGLRASTSSVLQTRHCNLSEVIEARPAEFRISFSGWKRMHIYQKNASVVRFLATLKELDGLPKYKGTRWVMFFHQYKNNLDELEPARRLAEDHRFDFVTFPATFMVYDHIIEGYTEEDHKTLSMLLETPKENIARMKKSFRSSDYCNMQEREVTLDAHGRMYLCQLMYKPKYIMGDFLAKPLKELRAGVMKHPMCEKCKAMGVGPYSLIFADPGVVKDPVARANRNPFFSGRKYQNR